VRLYARIEGTTEVTCAGVTYKPGNDGGFDFPNEVSDELASFHVRGRPMWEDQIGRQRRLIQEEAARRADPATLLDAVEQLVQQAKAESAKPVPAKPAVKAKAAA
jgi:hypothetical protein